MARQKLYQISASETPKSSQLLLPSLILPPDSFPLLQVSPPALQTCRLQPNSPCPKRKKSGESLPHIKNPRTQLTDSAHLLWLPCVHDSRSPQIDFSSCRRNLRRISCYKFSEAFEGSGGTDNKLGTIGDARGYSLTQLYTTASPE